MIKVSDRSYKILIWLLPVFIVFVARDLLWSQVQGVFTHIGNIRLVSGQIRSTGVHIRELPEMRSDYENLARKKAAIASSLFGAKAEARLYDLLMLKARESDVSIVSVVPRQRKIDAGFAEQPLSLEAAGSYAGLVRFINSIENVNRLMRVEELSMAKDRAGRLTADVKLLVFLYSDTLQAAPKAGKMSGRKEVFQDRQAYLADLNTALDVTIAESVHHASDHAGLERRGDPFGAASATTAKPATALAASQRNTIGLTLKGILWKEPPLAILESLDGRTYIVKQGESINGFVVSSITRTDVTIATPQGDHVLHQYDQK